MLSSFILLKVLLPYIWVMGMVHSLIARSIQLVLMHNQSQSLSLTLIMILSKTLSLLTLMLTMCSYLLAHGDGSFAVPTEIRIGYGAHPFSVAVGDYNNDKKLDFAVTNDGRDNLENLLADLLIFLLDRRLFQINQSFLFYNYWRSLISNKIGYFLLRFLWLDRQIIKKKKTKGTNFVRSICRDAMKINWLHWSFKIKQNWYSCI